MIHPDAPVSASRLRLLTYREDPVEVYERIEELGQPALLDSGGDKLRGRWDIICAQADTERSLLLAPSDSPQSMQTQLDQWMTAARSQQAEWLPPLSLAASLELPFQGGYLGHFSYELGRRLQGFAPASDLSLPLAVVHYYPWAVVQDGHTKQAYLVSDGSVPSEALDVLCQRLQGPAPAPVSAKRPRSTVEANEPSSRESNSYSKAWQLSEYERVFKAVKKYIRAGDCYQINIGQPFTATANADPVSNYRALRAVSAAPYSAFLPLGENQTLLCFSPERFLTVSGRRVTSSPIKGTRPRYADPAADRAAALELLNSEKERAENLMIVDLLRNDVGRFCVPGTVHAEQLFELQSYLTVHHLVSTIAGDLREDADALTLLLGCLPGGSITGAPKHRAMQLIDELEPAPRESWCGTVFYWSQHGRLDSNIVIRSLSSDRNTLSCWAGGGLVDDSELQAEYNEQEHKVGALLRALLRTLPARS